MNMEIKNIVIFKLQFQFYFVFGYYTAFFVKTVVENLYELLGRLVRLIGE